MISDSAVHFARSTTLTSLYKYWILFWGGPLCCDGFVPRWGGEGILHFLRPNFLFIYGIIIGCDYNIGYSLHREFYTSLSCIRVHGLASPLPPLPIPPRTSLMEAVNGRASLIMKGGHHIAPSQHSQKQGAHLSSEFCVVCR